MPLDQTLALSGAGLGAVGIVTVVVARLRADPTPALIVRTGRAAAAVRARAGAVNARLAAARSSGHGTTAPDPPAAAAEPASEPVPVPASEPAPAVASPTIRVRKRRRQRRDGRSNAELDDELVTSTALGWFALWLVTTLAIGYAGTEVNVLQILAQVAIAGSIVAIGLVVYDISRRRARHVGWMIDLFVATAAVASLPLWFQWPRFDQGRFDRLDRWLPEGGTIDVRLNSSIKDYGPGIVSHVLVQAAGTAAVLVMTLYIVATIVRRARGRYGHQPRDRWVSTSALVVTVVAAVAASGAAANVPVRTFGRSTFTTATAGTSATAGSTVGDRAPALALRTDRRGRVALLFARCGDDRILALTVNGHVVLGPDIDDGTGFGAAVGGGVTSTRVPSGVGPVTVVFRSTRRYETTVVFRARPRVNRFIPLRTKDTVAKFYKRGHGC